MSGVSGPGLPARAVIALRRWISGELGTRQLVRAGLNVVQFERWGVRPVREARFRKLAHDAQYVREAEALKAGAEAARHIIARHHVLTSELEEARQTVAHLRRIESAYHEGSQQLAQLSAALATCETNYQVAGIGVQAFFAAFQNMLFERAEATPASEAAAVLTMGNQPVEQTMATLINMLDDAHGARPFQYALPILARQRPFPLAWDPALPPLRIVDVGSQELDSESDMHAPLRRAFPTEIIGFDPFAKTQDGNVVEVIRADGSRIRTYPVLLGDGSAVKFHINRFDPTSSILPANHDLTRQFGLLDLAVEPVEIRDMPTSRMDEVLPTRGDDARIDLMKVDVQGAAHALLDNGRQVLAQTLVVHVELEFAEVYRREPLLGDVDLLLRSLGFDFVDFFSLGRQRYAAFESSPERAFHRGRTLWGDCVYVRGLDSGAGLSADELFRAACIMHSCYNKQDVAAELLRRRDALMGTDMMKTYLAQMEPVS